MIPATWVSACRLFYPILFRICYVCCQTKPLSQGVDLTNDALLFRCATLVATASSAEVTAAQIGSNLAPGEADPLAAMAFNLSSRPTAARKIILDFRGGAVTGTAWNNNYPNIVMPPYSRDADTSTYST
jgi:hypothetical protein